MRRNTTITTEVEIDVDMHDFSTDDLIYEIIYRVRNHKEEISNLDLMKMKGFGNTIDSIINDMKIDYILSIIDDYSVEEMRERLPKK